MASPSPLLLAPASQCLRVSDPSGRLTRLACSSVDLLWVMTYAPGTGTEGTPITVDFSCNADLAHGIHVRLVVGRRAVATQVSEIDPPSSGRWQLSGIAPAFSKQRSPSTTVPLTIQAVDKDNHIIDSVTFGDFVYRDLDTTSPTRRRPSLRIVPGDALDRSSKRRSPYSPSSSDSEYGSSQGSRPAAPALRRASRQGSELEDPTQTVVLDIATPLDDFCYDWEESELNAGRRLVRFRRLQDGNKLIVSAERITQADYNAEDIVISCIYRQETDSCCVTSVDIIHLLQRLVESDFEVDEKNRIRRNLEGLRPTTVSKTRPGFESFFQRIMDFPDPKPRKIEKDVKVFDWKLLPHALDKILSKYSLFASPPTISPKDEIPSPSFGPTFAKDIFTSTSSSASSAYNDTTFQSPREPQLDAFYLSHISPVVQLFPFPDCSPESSPDLHRRLSLQEDQLQSLYIDPDLMRGYYSEPDMVSPSYTLASAASGPLHPSPLYTAESSVVAHDTATAPSPSAFVPEHPSPHAEWTTTTTNDVPLVSPHETVFAPAPMYAYGPSDGPEVPLYSQSLSPYSMHPYDAFDFHALREHSAMLASQRA